MGQVLGQELSDSKNGVVYWGRWWLYYEDSPSGVHQSLVEEVFNHQVSEAMSLKDSDAMNGSPFAGT